MPVSDQNYTLPELGQDIRPQQPDRRREPKVTMSDDGQWREAHPHVLQRVGNGWQEFRDIERTSE